MKHLIIIGAAKSATSSLCYNFKHHPEIAISTPKETNYFRKTDIDSLDIEEYKQFWKNTKDKKVFLEASPNYTMGDSALIAQKMRKLIPHARLIYIMRDPLDRIESHFNFYVQRLSWNYSGNMLAPQLIDASNYKKHIFNFIEHFGESNVLLLNFDTLKKAPETTLKQVCNFAEISNNFTPPEYRNIAKTTRITRIQHWDRHFKTKYLGPLHPIIFNRPVQNALALNKELPKRKLSQKEIDSLINQYSETIRWLRIEKNMNLSSWRTCKLLTQQP